MLAVRDANPRPAGRSHYIQCGFLCSGLVSPSLKDDPSTIGREVALIKGVRRAGSEFFRRRFCIRPGGHRQQPDAIFLRYQKPLAVTGPILRISVRSAGCSEWFFGAVL